MGKMQDSDSSIARLGIHVPVVFRIRSGGIKHIFLDNLSFIMASLMYIAANVIDYLLTVSGIESDPLREGNPVLQEYVSLFGARHGILICKLLTCIGVLSAMRVIDLAYREKRTRLRAEYILYGGAILMTLGGLLWLF